MTTPARREASDTQAGDGPPTAGQRLTTVIIAVCLLGLLVEGGIYGYQKLFGEPDGRSFPRLEVVSLDGTAGTFAPDGADGPVTLTFLFTTTCPVCQGNVAGWNELHGALGDRVRIVGLSMDDAAATRGFVDELGVEFPVLVIRDPEALKEAISLPGVPMTLAIASDGTVEDFWYGPVGTLVRREVLARVTELVAGVEMPATPPTGADR